jgi:hypothetical protein
MKLLLTAMSGCLSLGTAACNSVPLALHPASTPITWPADSVFGLGFTLDDTGNCTIGSHTDHIASHYTFAEQAPESPAITEAFENDSFDLMPVEDFLAASASVTVHVPQLVTMPEARFIWTVVLVWLN